MASIRLNWRTNLRANLVLWPDLAPNISALASCDGAPYDEDALLKRFPSGSGEKSPTDARSVRNTLEVMALSGFAYKENGSNPRFLLTDLGRGVFSFFGTGGATRFVNDGNRPLVAEVLIRALSIVVEYRAIWKLMRQSNDLLTNEELNRAMPRIRFLEDVDATAAAILDARNQGDPTRIGPRLYEDEKYADPLKMKDQRKAINPLFLLAGGGRLFMAMEDSEMAEEPLRRLEDWVIPIIDRRLEEPVPQIHASTEPEVVRLISEHACVSPDVWRKL